MPSLSSIAYYLSHPQELRSIVQWKLWHDPVHQRDESKESPELKECFKYLDLTSRSFAAVIKELHPELLVPTCLFYLVLRGLDTVEDDMTIDIEEKEPLLRGFDEVLFRQGWTYNGNGPNEKDRELLVHFDVVIAEFARIKAPYQEIIRDITKRMGNGMADYANNRDHNLYGVKTVKEYELYCHYVAGLVGEGLTRLFVEADLANPALLKRPDLHESMGQFLQQTNIIRDIKEDHDDKRYFWPREIWSKHVDKFDDLFEPANREKALACSSEMVLTALRRADDCLFYLAGIRDQSVFNFCAIPQSMAIATLDLCFQNPEIFKRNVKITKGSACDLMTKSTQNLQLVCEVFRKYARSIHKKNKPVDPNFLDISVACGQVEVFIESIFPTQTARTLREAKAASSSLPAETPEQEKKRQAEAVEARWDVIYMALASFGLMFIITAIMFGIAWYFGARFDVALSDILPAGLFSAPAKPALANPTLKAGKDEL